MKTDRAPPTHIVVIDPKGNIRQTLELPPNTSLSECEVLTIDPQSKTKTHIPMSTLLDPLGALDDVPMLPLPTAKIEKELFLGTLVAPMITTLYGMSDVPRVLTNPRDPPDLLLSVGSRSIGIELCELVYPERYANDAQMSRLEKTIRRLPTTASFTDWQIHFTLKCSPESELRLPKQRALEDALRDLFARLEMAKALACVHGAASLLTEEHLPPSCTTFLHAAIIDNIGPPSGEAPRPILRFANRAQPFSAELLQSIVVGPIERKFDMRLGSETVLLIWSRHRSFAFCIRDTCNVITDLLFARMRSPFRDVIYLHRSTENIVAVLMTNRTIAVRVTDESTINGT